MSKSGYHKDEKRKLAVKLYNASPRGRYQAHKLNARTRKIEFLLSFEEWWEIWKPHWEERGRGKGMYHMGRTNDTGPYAVGNVYLVKHEINCSEDKPRVQSKRGTMPPEHVIQNMVSDYANGMTYLQVANKYVCSSGTVMHYVRSALLDKLSHRRA